MRAQPRRNRPGEFVVVHDERAEELEGFELVRDGPVEPVDAEADLGEVRGVRQRRGDASAQFVLAEVQSGELGAVAELGGISPTSWFLRSWRDASRGNRPISLGISPLILLKEA